MFPARQADVLFKGNKIGIFGVIHPTVLENFGWKHPVSVLELNLELLMEGFFL
jgi:phenylalanyl-tRNA synthetase beta chain